MKRNRLQEAEMAVLATLKKGRPNATTGGEIATITNIPPERCTKPFITYQPNITFLSSVKEAACVEVISLLRLKKNY